MTTDTFGSVGETYPNGPIPTEGMTLAQVQTFTKVETPSITPEVAVAAEGQGMGFGLDCNDGGTIIVKE